MVLLCQKGKKCVIRKLPRPKRRAREEKPIEFFREMWALKHVYVLLRLCITDGLPAQFGPTQISLALTSSLSFSPFSPLPASPCIFFPISRMNPALVVHIANRVNDFPDGGTKNSPKNFGRCQGLYCLDIGKEMGFSNGTH